MLSLSRNSFASNRQCSASRHALSSSQLCAARSAAARRPAARPAVVAKAAAARTTPATAQVTDEASIAQPLAVGPVCKSLLNLPDSNSSWESLQQLVTPDAATHARMQAAVEAVQRCAGGKAQLAGPAAADLHMDFTKTTVVSMQPEYKLDQHKQFVEATIERLSKADGFGDVEISGDVIVCTYECKNTIVIVSGSTRPAELLQKVQQTPTLDLPSKQLKLVSDYSFV